MEHERVAIVTGATSGIGQATADLLADEGWGLVLAARTPENLERTVERIGRGCLGVPTDIGDQHECIRLIDRAVDHFGRLDALVSNAGVAPLASIGETTPAMIDEAFRVNAIGPAYLVSRAWPIFVKQGAGRIVHVSSMATDSPFPGFFAYAASKAAVNLMAKSAHEEGHRDGIRSWAVAPGAVETPLLRSLFNEQTIPKQRTLSPETVAGVIVECLGGDRDGASGEVIWVPSP